MVLLIILLIFIAYKLDRAEGRAIDREIRADEEWEGWDYSRTNNEE